MSRAVVRIAWLSTASLFLLACEGGGPEPQCRGGKCDAPTYECEDQRYGDGSCDLALDCPVPDIDCFHTFEDDAAASEWFGELEGMLAAEAGREPRALLPQSDPRYPRMRELLDRGWLSYQDAFPLGEVGEHRVGLVLVDDPSINAFVAPDPDLGRAALAVMVQSGVLDSDASDEELLGLVMHELQHAVGLHALPGRAEALRRYYQVRPGEPEPLGKSQPNDPAAQEALETLIGIGSEVGLQPYEELNDLPFFPGLLFTTMQLAHRAGIEHDAAACENAGAALELFGEFVQGHFRTLDGALMLGEDGGDLDFVTSEYAAALRDECLAGSTATIFDILAVQLGTTPDVLRSAIPADDLALLDDKPVIDAIQALTRDRYATIHAIDDALQSRSGAGIESLRYYSTEEAADDVTVPVLRQAGLHPDGLSSFFLAILPPDDRAACSAILDAGEVPPYGVDLTDNHHATCFRAWHLRQLAAATGGGEAERRAPRPELERQLEALRPGAWPRRDRLSDHIPDCFPTR